MLKKILLGLSLGACLATSSFSEELKLDKKFCKAYNHVTYNHFVHDKSLDSFDIGSRHTILKDSGDAIFTRDIGALSTDFLKENGIGYSVNMNWGNIVVKFDDYLRYANSKEDKKELSKFLMNILTIIAEDEIAENTLDELLDENNRLRKDVFLKMEFEAKFEAKMKESKKGNKRSFSTLTSYFAETKDKQIELYGPFAKYVINGDFERAKTYVKSVNAESGINELYEQFENACEK